MTSNFYAPIAILALCLLLLCRCSLAADIETSNLYLPSPASGNGSILWGSPSAPVTSLTSNGAGGGITIGHPNAGPGIISIIKRDVQSGVQPVGNVNFEAPNASGGAYRAGWIYGIQLQNTTGQESGMMQFVTRWEGQDYPPLTVGYMGVAAVIASSLYIQVEARYDDNNRAMLYHNGTQAYVGTLTDQCFTLRAGNVDRITYCPNGDVQNFAPITVAGPSNTATPSGWERKLDAAGTPYWLPVYR